MGNRPERQFKLTNNQKVGLIKAFMRFTKDRDVNKLMLAIKVLIPAAYVVFPLDLIPDPIPVIGLVDDVTVLLAALGMAWKVVKKYRYSEHPKRL